MSNKLSAAALAVQSNVMSQLSDRQPSWRARLVHAAMHFTSERADAEDLVHTALLRAIEQAPNLPSDVNWEAWLRRVVRRLAVDLLRRNKRSLVANDIEPADLAATEEEKVDPIWTRYTVDELYTSLEQCSSAQRQIYKLHHLEGVSYTEIAARLNIPKGTVATRLFRARETVAKHLRKLTACANDRSST